MYSYQPCNSKKLPRSIGSLTEITRAVKSPWCSFCLHRCTANSAALQGWKQRPGSLVDDCYSATALPSWELSRAVSVLFLSKHMLCISYRTTWVSIYINIPVSILLYSEIVLRLRAWSKQEGKLPLSRLSSIRMVTRPLILQRNGGTDPTSN